MIKEEFNLQDPPTPHEYTGHFEIDYIDACKSLNHKPMLLVKHPQPIVTRPQTNNSHHSNSTKPSSPAKNNNTTNNDVPVETISKSDLIAGTKEKFKYKFTPSIHLSLVNDGDIEDRNSVDEFDGASINGWKVFPGTIEAISTILPFSQITHLTLWNCGLTESTFQTLLLQLPISSIKTLELTQNPLIPELSYASLITNTQQQPDTDQLTPQLKTLSLRSNCITCLGARAIAQALKGNRTLGSLNLWNNLIGRDGAEGLADALKVNLSLFSLSLGGNFFVGDEGVLAICKVLSNYQLPNEELASKKKILVEMDKLRKEILDDDATGGLKKGNKNVNRLQTPQNIRRASPNPRGGVKAPSTEDSKDSTVAESKKNAAGGAKGVKKDGKKQDVAQNAQTVLKKKGVTISNADLTIGEKKGGKKVEKTPGVGVGGGGASDKKGAKGKPAKLQEEVQKEETEENGGDNLNGQTLEPMFELNGQYYVVGNRTLNNLNLTKCGITDVGLKYISDAIHEQELSIDSAPDGCFGIFRMLLKDNLFDKDSPLYKDVQYLINLRNPFIEPDLVTNEDLAITEGIK